MFYRRVFRPVKKESPVVGKTKRGKGTKIMAIADAAGFPIAIHTESASPHEAILVDPTLELRFVEPLPEKLIDDKAYDSESLDEHLKQDYGIDMIAPHRTSRRKPKTQHGRKLLRYCKRWKVKRLFAWIQNYQFKHRVRILIDFSLNAYI